MEKIWKTISTNLPSDLLYTMSVADYEDSEFSSIQDLALRIQIAAAGIASSFLLLPVPNVETITLTAFFVGFLFSLRYAMSITLTMTIGWELLVSSILGFSGPTFFFKIIAWSIITGMGRFARTITIKKPYEFAVFGTISALIFDLLVTLAIPLFFVNTGSSDFFSVFLTSFITGIPFTIFHTLGNLVLFAALPTILETTFPPLQRNFQHILQLNRNYFEKKSPHILALLIIGLIIITPMTAIYFEKQFNNDSKGDESIVVVFHFDYGTVKMDETITANATTTETVFVILQRIVNIDYALFADRPFIEEINNVRNNRELDNHYWNFYLNDDWVQVDVNSLTLHNNDHIDWRYE